MNAYTHLASIPELERQYAAATKGKGKLRERTAAIKDVFATKGEEGEATTCSSKMLSDYRSPFEATVVSRLRSAGALVIGKTNMDEFGMGSANVHSQFGSTLNPSHPDGLEAFERQDEAEKRVPGGSSGGSAAAVAAETCDFALASDTGGSTRLPASYCGVIGFKPSYGLLSRHGMVAYASSLDTVGIMSKEVGTAREVFDVLTAHDPLDPTSASLASRSAAQQAHSTLLSRLGELRESSSSSLKRLAGVRIGIPSELYPHPSNSPLLTPSGPIRTFLHTLKHDLDATLVPVRVKTAPLSLSAYYVIASAEASSNLARYSGLHYGHRAEDPKDGEERQQLYARTRSEGFGKEVKKRILLGTFALSAEAFDNYFLQAQRVRLLLQNELDALFRTASPLRPSTSSTSTSPSPSGSTRQSDGVDFLLHPSALSTAPLLSSYLPSSSSPSSSPQEPYKQDLLSLPASLAGLPALSVPAGWCVADGWPVGMTLVGQWGGDEGVMRVGEVVEAALKRRTVL